MTCAQSIRVRGVVQGVGFRPFVFRLARANMLSGWVLNGEEGVEIHVEGDESDVGAFVKALKVHPPPAAQIAEVDIQNATLVGSKDFVIRETQRSGALSVRISPDLPVCHACLAELFDPDDSRYRYPYINCTDCGPRYSIVTGLPYDRLRTTMNSWPLDSRCRRAYEDPADRRFHAQPLACPDCGPHYFLKVGSNVVEGDSASIGPAVEILKKGSILAVKGLGGYHLACDAANSQAVNLLRERKFRKEKPFALMARDLNAARRLAFLSTTVEELLQSAARPIVLSTAQEILPHIAPDNDELGIMLPYTPLHHLLFAAGAPDVLVMTSANRSSEPIAYEDADAVARLQGLADAFLIGERPIARRVDDSVVRDGVFGPVILRRSRGYAPGAVSRMPGGKPLLALGADLKNAIALVVDGHAFVSQHIGDLEHFQAFRAFQETIEDLVSMYEVNWDEINVVCDAHPQYASSQYAAELPATKIRRVQHHRAHVASVLAEREAWDERVIGFSFDGTGYGDDGAIWGGEVFEGSIADGFRRTANLRYASLPGGDAAARFPVQAAAGFLAQLDGLPDLTMAPFRFPARFLPSLRLACQSSHNYPTTSMGRLFDAVAALLGFTNPVTFEGQAAVWLEQLARRSSQVPAYPFPMVGNEFDFRPLLESVITDRLRGRAHEEIARAFHSAIGSAIAQAAHKNRETSDARTVVLSGGVFQNDLLLGEAKRQLESGGFQIWTNHLVPPNDGGISLGQAALAAASFA